MKDQQLKRYHLMPLHMVSVDHYISWAPGRIYHIKFKLDPQKLFLVGCVFIDNASGYVRIKHKVDINDTETVNEKLTLDSEDQSQGLVIKGYHNDNGIFNALQFMQQLLKKQQNIRFSGAIASHKNGAVESFIKTVVTVLNCSRLQRLKQSNLLTYY